MKSLARWWPAATFTLLVFGLGVAGAQGPRRDIGRNIPLPEVTPVAPVSEDSRADLVTLDVVVTTADGRPISGLTQNQFRLLVDDEEQTIESFDEVDGAVNVALVIEFGALLNRSVYYDLSIIPEDRTLVPAEAFLGSLETEDWAAIVGYDGRPWIETDFTQNKAVLIDTIRDYRRRSNIDALQSAFYDAVYLTLDLMDSISGTKAILLLSSGWDRGSRNNYGELMDIANASDTAIYGVGMSEEALLFLESQMDRQPFDSNGFPDPIRDLPNRSELLQARNALVQLSEATGGASFFPRTDNEYAGMLNGINSHLRSRYRLGFLPTGLEPSGELREFSLELTPEASIPEPDSVTFHHRKGFFF